MKYRSKLEGAEELERKLKAAGKLGLKALAGGAFVEMSKVINDAKTRTPVDTGTLRASGTVLPPRIRGGSVTVTGGFGGAAKDYALEVHENLKMSHTVGEAKFLERAWLDRLSYMDENLGREVRRHLATLQG